MIFKKARDQLSHMNCSYTFLPTTCTKDFGLDWDYFENFHKLIYSTIAIHEHVIAKISNLLHFLDSWVIYKKEKGIPLVGPKCTPPTCWRLDQKEMSTYEFNSLL
jgi:hypothetical protein